MIKILSCSQVRQIEETASESGISYLRLMENAGSACAKVIRNRFDKTSLRRVTVICGKGKNGGDGFVIARKLNDNGYSVNVILAMGKPSADTACEMFARLGDTSVDIELFDKNNSNQLSRISDCDILVDCIFGTGFKGVPDEKTAEIFELINQSRAYVVSVDIPSGLCADSSEIEGPAVRADMTVASIAYKYALAYYPSAEYAGEVKIVSIGIPESIINEFTGCFTLTQSEIKTLLPKREENTCKGDYGSLLVIAGSYEMPGAALMSCASAVECGVGLVKSAFPDKAYPVMMSSCPEKVLIPLETNKNGRISSLSLSRINTELEKCSAVLIGCGLGCDNDTLNVVKFVLENSKVPVILDADGINLMKDSIDIIKRSDAGVIITPHPGEAARLLKTSAPAVQKDRIAAAEALYDLTGAVVVLKGSRTVVTDNGVNFYINMTGSSAMATGGSGDVLAGMTASFAAQGISPKKAAILGVYLHGLAGDSVSSNYSKAGTTPQKIINELAKTISSFEK